MDDPQTDINANPQLLPSPREEEASETVEPQNSTNAPISANPPAVPYDPTFEDDVMEVILNPPSPSASEDEAIQGMDLEVLPEDLPLALHDFRRQHPSLIPGIKLPTPDSSLLGAAALPVAALDDMVQRYRSDHRLATSEDVDRALNEEIEAQIALLRVNMLQRKDAIEANEGVEKEIRQLNMEREMQRRVEEKWKSGRRESKASNEMAIT